MARYCFYCGRELASGEKCNCRSHAAGGSHQEQVRQTHSSAGPTQAKTSQSSSSQTKTTTGPHATGSRTGSTKAKGPGFWSRFQSATTNSQPFGQKKHRSGSFGPKKTLDTAAILAGFGQYLRYLTRPVDSIRQAVQYLNPHRLLVVSLIHAALGGFAMVRVDQLGTLDLLLQLTQVQLTANPFLAGLFLFIQGAGVALVFDWLLILVTHLTLQYVFKTPYALTRVAASFVPVIFYLALFQLLALMSLTLVPVASLLTLAAGLAIALLVLYLAIRQLTGFDENRCFVLVTFVIVVFTSLMSLVINLALPVLTLLLEQSLPL
ncbi:MAG: hypothetical protein PHQ83_01435 [Eubacteriales bacterium]|nr:hypothetical protein [Eubacteriales bacterium]